jgi:hypothetical protein
MRLFQYGQVNFLSGNNNSKYLYFTPMSLEGSGNKYRISIYKDDNEYKM